MKYRTDIDGLRAVAIVSVVLNHADFHLFSGGYVGVDVFFVISGFLITTIISKEISAGTFSLSAFYERRARRILPALITMVLACFVVAWFTFLPSEMKHLGESAFATALFVSNVYFALKVDYFSQAAEFAPLLHTWSLAVEEQFYLFFPPLLVLLMGFGKSKAFWAVAGLSALSLVSAALFLPLNPDWTFYMSPFRLWELGVGAALSLAYGTGSYGRAYREGLGAIGLAAVLGPVFFYTETTAFPGLAAIPPVFGAALLIWLGGQKGGSFVNTLLARRGPVWLGLISYSLYLWHWPVLAIMRNLTEMVVLPTEFAWAAIVGSLGLAWLSYHMIEQPFRTPSHRSNGFRRSALFATSALFLTGIAGAGWIFYDTKGYPARLPETVRQIAAFSDGKHRRLKGCLYKAPNQTPCTLGTQTGDPDRIDFLLWGDSHADALAEGLDLAAKRMGQSGVFAGRAGCPPIRHVQRFSHTPTCTEEFSERVWSWLQTRQDVPVVVLHARWPIYVEGTRPDREPGSALHLEWAGDPQERPEHTDNASLMADGLQDLITLILQTGRRVVLLGPVPEVGRHVPNSLARAELFGRPSATFLTRGQHDSRVARTEDILKRLTQRNPQVRYMPLADLFCDDQLCRVEASDGTPLYVDNNHISPTSAETLVAARLARAFAPLTN